MKKHILFAEDDANLGMVVQEYLEMKDYEVTLCTDGVQAEKAFGEKAYDLCVLDVMMPRMDGFELLKRIRTLKPTQPVIFTTAKGRLEDKAEGYNLGVDDYLTKPFSIEELVMRMEAVLKRSAAATPIVQDNGLYQLGHYTFDYNKRLMTGPEERKLSSKESELMRLLCQHEGRLLERELALSAIWGSHNYYTSRSMDVYITKLRKYLKDDPMVEIINVHGEGFKLIVHKD